MHFTTPFYGEVNRVMMRRLKYIPREVKFGKGYSTIPSGLSTSLSGDLSGNWIIDW